MKVRRKRRFYAWTPPRWVLYFSLEIFIHLRQLYINSERRHRNAKLRSVPPVLTSPRVGWPFNVKDHIPPRLAGQGAVGGRCGRQRSGLRDGLVSLGQLGELLLDGGHGHHGGDFGRRRSLGPVGRHGGAQAA